MWYPILFGMVMGLGIIGQWAMTLHRHEVPELASEPARVWFHIGAETVAALAPVCSAVALLLNLAWGRTAHLVALGMLFYTALVSPGYLVQQGKRVWLAVIAAVMALGVVSLFMVA